MKPKRVKDFICRAVDNPLEIQPIHLWGPPGIGKSAIPKQVAEEKEIGFVDMRLAQRDPTDLRGIPAVIDGNARWLPPPELPTDRWCLDCERPLHNGDAEKGVCRFCNGKRITNRGILFLDELTSAPPLTQASAYQLTLDRKIGEYSLPDGWYILAAGNRIEDRAVVYRMSTALANRFSHIDFEVNLEDWTDWALGAGVDTNIVAFLNWRIELLFAFNPESSEKAFPTPRCLGKESKIKMWDGTEKEISGIKVGDKIVGFKNGKFIKASVLKTFRTFVGKGMEVSTKNRALRCSNEHSFKVDNGYLTANQLSANIPVYICSEGDINVYREGHETKEKMAGEISPNSGRQGLYGRSNRWGGEFFPDHQTSMGQNLLRASVFGYELLTPVPGLLPEKGICHLKRQEKRKKTELAGQIHGDNMGQPSPLFNRGIATISCPKETCRTPSARLHLPPTQTKIRSDDDLYSRVNGDSGASEIVELQAARKIISVRVRDYQETFYDFTSSSGNYVANGFIVHNSWEFASRMVKISSKMMLPELLEGTVGKGATAEFMQFLKLQTELPDLDTIFKGDDYVPKKISLKYALVSALVGKAKTTQFERLLQYSKALPAEFSVLMVMMMVSKDEQGVAACTSWEDWAKEHREVLVRKRSS